MGLVKDSEPSTTKRNEAKWYDMIWPGITRIGSSGGSPARQAQQWCDISHQQAIDNGYRVNAIQIVESILVSA